MQLITAFTLQLKHCRTSNSDCWPFTISNSKLYIVMHWHVSHLDYPQQSTTTRTRQNFISDISSTWHDLMRLLISCSESHFRLHIAIALMVEINISLSKRRGRNEQHTRLHQLHRNLCKQWEECHQGHMTRQVQLCLQRRIMLQNKNE